MRPLTASNRAFISPRRPGPISGRRTPPVNMVRSGRTPDRHSGHGRYRRVVKHGERRRVEGVIVPNFGGS